MRLVLLVSAINGNWGRESVSVLLSYVCKSGLARDSLKLFYSADRLAVRGTVYLANGRERFPTLSKEKV